MKKYLIYIIPVVLMFSSCLTTLQPLVTKENIVSDKRFAGKWNTGDNQLTVIPIPESPLAKDIPMGNEEKQEPLKGSEKEDSIYFSKGYLVSIENGESIYRFIGLITQVEKHTFLNLYPLGINAINSNEDMKEPQSSIRSYSIARVNWNPSGQKMEVRFLNGDYIKSSILSGKMRIKHEYDPLYGSFLITASPEEQIQFIKKYGEDERFYEKGQTWELNKAGS